MVTRAAISASSSKKIETALLWRCSVQNSTLFVLLIQLMIVLSIVRPYFSLVIDDVKSSSNNEPQLVPPSVANFDNFANSPSFNAYSSLGSYDDSDLIRSQESIKSSWRKATECKSDLNCLNNNNICLNGNCVRICTYKESLAVTANETSNLLDCAYLHCDSKRTIQFRPKPVAFESLGHSNLFQELSIETNNYPQLTRYLSKKKCSWILNQGSSSSGSGFQTNSQHRFIQLNFERFVTQLSNDYLYIFAGDSIYSPLIAALSGNQASSDEPSLTADQENIDDIETIRGYESNDEEDEVEEDDPTSTTNSNESSPSAFDNETRNKKIAPLNITLFNLNTLYLLFKTDVTSTFSILNNLKSARFNNKPSGISIKYKFSSSCYNEILCYNEAIQAKLQASELTQNCSTEMERKNCKSGESSSRAARKLVETVNVADTESDPLDSVRSPSKRAFHCSFEYNDYMYAVGGFSFSPTPISFVSRLTLKYKNESELPQWEHLIDRKPSTIVNRANRRFFGEPDFKQIKLELPRPRYAHSCVLDKDDDHFYMYGGVIFNTSSSGSGLPQNAHKETTNELWSYNLITNKWTLLNSLPTSLNETSSSSGIYENANSTQQQDQSKNNETMEEKSYILPIAVSGHSMYVVERGGGAYEKSILIFFGFSEYYASNLNLIQEYVIGKRIWLLHNTPSLNIGYAHTSTFDKPAQLIYFHGGLVVKSTEFLSSKSTSSVFEYAEQFNLADAASLLIGGVGGSASRFTQSISSGLYSFDLNTFEWHKLPKSAHSCYGHSLVTAPVSPTKLVFYGGLCDSNRFSFSSTVYMSNQINVYDTGRQEWINRFTVSAGASDESMNEYSNVSRFSIKLSRRQRNGHSSFVFNRSLYVFAGFNGFFLRDLFRIDLDRLGLVTMMNSSFDDSKKTIASENIRRTSRSGSYNMKSSSSINRSYVEYFLNKTYNSNPKNSNTRNRGELLQLQSRIYPSSDNSSSSTLLPCSRFTSCLSCHLDPNCIWHKSQCEAYGLTAGSHSSLSRPIYKKPQCSQLCVEHTTCENCTSLSNLNGQYQSECVWCASQSKCLLKKAVHVHFLFGECLYLTSDRTKCFTSSDDTSVHSESSIGEKTPNLPIIPSPFSIPKPTGNGVSSETLSATSQKIHEKITSYCSNQYTNCSSCIRDERCGWCTNDHQYNSFDSQHLLNSGLGKCLEGGLSGTIESMSCSSNWFYDECPPCECNGHSNCSPNVLGLSAGRNRVRAGTGTATVLSSMVAATSTALDPNRLVCAQPCANNTMGEFCETCAQGYFGHAENGGSCSVCECGLQANLCDSRKGSCYCHTKGVVGTKCDICDNPRYSGRPDLPDGTCFYNLTTDYQFTFNLNKDSDRYYTRINFVNHIAHGMDEDIDFMVRCFRETAYINVTYVSEYAFLEENNEDENEALDENERRLHHSSSISTVNDVDWPFELIENLSYLWSNLNTNSRLSSTGRKKFLATGSRRRDYYFGPLASQNVLLTKINCTSTELKYVFYNRDLNYADKNRNFIFIVYVYDFESPITVQVAFSRRTRVQLLHFFITFFGCLLSLLIIAFITWKARQCYVDHRTERQRIASQERMSNRPFTRLLVDVINNDDKEKLLMQTGNFNNKKKVTRTESSRSTSLGDSGRRFLNSIKSRLKFDSSSNSSNKPRLGGNNGQNNGSPSSSDPEDVDIGQRPMNTLQIEDITNRFKLMPMAVEPLVNNKSAVITCILKLPQGDLKSTPKGSSPFVLCSAYAQISSASSLVNYYTLEGDETGTTAGQASTQYKSNEV